MHGNFWASFLSPTAAVAALLFCGLVMAARRYIDSRNKKFAIVVICGAFLIKLVLIFIYFHLWLVPGNQDIIGPDGEGYSQRGWYIAKVLKGEKGYGTPTDEWVFKMFYRVVDYYGGKLPPFNSRGNTFFTYFIGFVYYLFGYVPIMIKSLNLAISGFSSIIVYNMAKHIYNARSGRLALLIFTFFPSIFIFSMSLLREPLIIFCVLVILYKLIGLSKTITLKDALSLLTVLLLILFLREELFVLMVLLAGLVILFRVTGRSKFIVLLGMACMLAYAVTAPMFRATAFSRPGVIFKNIAPVIFSRNASLYFAGGRLAYRIFPEKYYEEYKKYPTREAYYNSKERITVGEFIRYMPKGVFFYLMRPFPFINKGVIDILFSIQMVAWYCLMAFAALGLCRTKIKIVYPMLLYIAMMIFFSSMIDANEGIVLRHRDCIVPLIVIFASGSVCGRPDKFIKRTYV